MAIRMFRYLFALCLRFGFYLLYNPLAFTYDWVSAFVSRGQWRAWTRAAMPYIVGTRVLDIPAGTGNLLLDLRAAGYASIGVDVSAAMLQTTRAKFVRARLPAPILRARAQALPFAAGAFDSITLTFPPGFVREPRAWAELARVLADDGRVIWVDAARLLPRDVPSRALDRALDVVGGGGVPFQEFARMVLARAGLDAHIEIVRDETSVVTIVLATKRRAE
jgi:ubiquinone/menaquinone biosynthesis C-methylase UbiE